MEPDGSLPHSQASIFETYEYLYNRGLEKLNSHLRSAMFYTKFSLLFFIPKHLNGSWLRHCATSRKDSGSIPDGVTGVFHWLNTSGRTMALGSTQPVREMSTRGISWG